MFGVPSYTFYRYMILPGHRWGVKVHLPLRRGRAARGPGVRGALGRRHHRLAVGHLAVVGSMGDCSGETGFVGFAELSSRRLRRPVKV